jgi:ABC-2 type transport system permease protein
MLVSPVPTYLILLGYITGGVARGITVGVAVSAVSLLFSDLHIHNFAVMTSTMVLTATLFSLAGFINGIYAQSFDDSRECGKFFAGGHL